MRFLAGRLWVAPLVFLTTTASGQYGPPRTYEPRSVSRLIDRIHFDLDRAYAGWSFSNSDRRRLDHAEHDLRDFARKWYRGRFDKGEIDEAINSVQHVVDRNQMPSRDREALYYDLGQLRGLRAGYDRHEIGFERY
jgi:hypothetical protein